MTPPPDLPLLSSSEKDALILALILALIARLDALEAENQALRERLNQPPKTPDNSSKPPSQGQKANAESKTKPKGKPHAGAHRPPHPNPTRRREAFGRFPSKSGDIFQCGQGHFHDDIDTSRLNLAHQTTAIGKPARYSVS